MKLTYGEQLKHPNWQRKRLEVLNHYGFKCCACDAADKMLHVHHKNYIKGRQAWDYPLDNFESLCEDCHKEAHEAKEKITETLAQIPSSMWGSVASLLAGWARDYVDEDTTRGAWDTQTKLAGELAWHMGNYPDAETVLEVCGSFSCLNPDGFLEALREATRKDMA